MLTVLLEVIAPVFLVIGVGVLIGRWVGADLPAMSRIVLYSATPALVFTSLKESELELGSLLVLAAGLALTMVLMFLLSRAVSHGLARPVRRGFVASNVFVNSGNLLLPVSLFAFGPDGLQRALLLYVLATVAIFLFGPLTLAGRNALQRDVLLRIVRLPVLWAALAGGAFSLLDWSLPLGLERGVSMLGEAAIPLVLLMLGLQIYQGGWHPPRRLHLTSAGLKLLAGPLIAYLAARLVGAQGLDLAILTLLGAMPPAVNNFILALEFKADSDSVARILMLSTVASLATVPVVITLLGRVL